MTSIETFSDGILFNEIQYLKENDFVKVRYKNKIIDIETPLLRIPFGIKQIDSRYLLQLSIDDKDKNEKNSDFLMFINMLESHVKENLYKDFKNKQFVSKIYHKDKYPPLVGLELKYNTEVMDDNKNRVTINEYLNESFSATIDFSYNGIWFNENRYGLSFKINKIIIKDIKEPKIKIVF
jgi:hypothetical protein